tara:strand:- start:80 stop:532 length:453 start_codon:yes stop_codon:yes gene_type:complete
MRRNKKWSSNDKNQLLVENFRKFMEEGDFSAEEEIHGEVSPIPGRPDPRFGRMEIDFDSDVDKALYIVYDPKKRSKKEPEFLSWLSSLGYTQEQMEREGKAIVDALKKQLSSHPDFPGWSTWSQMTSEKSGKLSIPQMAGEPESEESTEF